MRTRRLSLAVTVCVALSMLAVLGKGVYFSWQSQLATPMPIVLEDAAFSTDDGQTWQPVGDGADLRKHRGDVAVRGHFNMATRDGWNLNLFLQHQQMEMYVNGQMTASFAREFHEIRPEWCADIWTNISLPDISTQDVVEFRLYSLHRFGADGSACEKMLSSLRLGDPFFIFQWMTGEKAVQQYLGMVLMIIGFVLLAITGAALWMKSPLQSRTLYTALLAIGEGLYWLANASEIAHYANGSIAFYNIGRFVGRMLVAFALLACMADVLDGKRRQAAWCTTIASGLISTCFLLINLSGVLAFCEISTQWKMLQLLCMLSGLIVCLWEMMAARHSLWSFLRLLSFALAYGSLLFDNANQMFGWFAEMHFSRNVCGVVALCHAASLLLQLPASYAAIKRAEKLSEELHNSRIVLAMSQIRTHFIFNVLNAISGLCKSDPELADQELVRFSRYLRNNIDIMQEDRPIPFKKALDHMHNYVYLEQLRFEEKILLDENYECMDFMIPSLVIQPLVENAIKHGLLPREEGGMIRVSTRRCGDEVMIEIVDDGVGFDTKKEIAKTSVGLSNVRFRVERMMGGRMKLESEPGKGTVVRVWLPAEKGEETCTLSM